MSVKIASHDATAALERVVARAGRSYVYQKLNRDDTVGPLCSYVRGGCADCGVGRALADLGVPVQILQELDRFGDASITAGAVQQYLYDNGFELTVGAVNVFGDFQQAQDDSHEWGTCLDVVYRRKAEREVAAIRG